MGFVGLNNSIKYSNYILTFIRNLQWTSTT